jgi:hypothetical protein
MVQGDCKMMNNFWSRHVGKIAICSGMIGASVYWLMINVTLAEIQAISGQVPFDMRPFGYGPAEAAVLLDGLTADGRAYYLSHQIPLDTIYPAMLALTLVGMNSWLGQRMKSSTLVQLGIAASLGAAVCDYAENLGVAAMILTWPEPTDLLVKTASIATIAKSILTTVAVTLVLITGAKWTFGYLKKVFFWGRETVGHVPSRFVRRRSG